MARPETLEYLEQIPVLEILFPDYRVAGIDPGFLFFSRNEKFHDSFTLPYRAAKRLYDTHKDSVNPPPSAAV